MADPAITSLVPWFGSKRRLASRIVAELGDHRAYWEPVCGSMATLLSKPRASQETVNDLHGDLINLARCVQHAGVGPRLYRRLRRVLCSDAEYSTAVDRLAGACERSDFGGKSASGGTMSDLLTRIEEAHAAAYSRELAVLLKDCAARIRELEAELQGVSRTAAEWIQPRMDLLERIEKAAGPEDPLDLIAAAKKLPMTKDGVRVTPGDHIFVVHSEHDISEVSVGDYEKRTVTSRPDSCYQRTWHCYSTREAAEKERKA